MSSRVGVDCSDVGRWRAMLDELASGAARRLFTEREHRLCRAARDPAALYAALWCAKEAVFKALGPGAPADLRRIEISFDRSGKPRAAFPPGGPRRASVRLSLSATPALAMAVAVARR